MVHTECWRFRSLLYRVFLSLGCNAFPQWIFLLNTGSALCVKKNMPADKLISTSLCKLHVLKYIGTDKMQPIAYNHVFLSILINIKQTCSYPQTSTVRALYESNVAFHLFSSSPGKAKAPPSPAWSRVSLNNWCRGCRIDMLAIR